MNKLQQASDGAEKFTFSTIGVIQSSVKYHYEAPRQSVYAATGAFLLWKNQAYCAAAEDLQGFERIWLIWVFNLNKHQNWRAKVRVPVPAERDMYSVFATRSPYRPNPIGISAVELLEITPQGLKLGGCDLLDGTAVLDVKPYIPDVDAFPESQAGWRDRIDKNSYSVIWSPQAEVQARFIAENGELDLKNFAQVQLASRPTDKTRKRLEADTQADQWILHCRTWKIHFELKQAALQVKINFISSNYSSEDLQIGTADIYGDKNLHRAFISRFDAEAATDF